MTLILTEISRLGIVMAADSAVTQDVITLDGVHEYKVLTGVKKLQIIDKLDAGIAVWGEGTIILDSKRPKDSAIDTDLWLRDFIRVRRNDYNSIDEFATLLQNELRKYIPEIDAGLKPGGTLGFLLAGYVNHEGQRLPSFYHIHNGESTTLRDRGVQVENPNIVNANHDITPEIAKQFLAENVVWLTRNGDYVTYVNLFNYIGEFLRRLPSYNGLIIPDSRNLRERAEWYRFQIRTMSELYRLSSRHLPVIGGKVDTLLITPAGVDECGLTF